MNTPCSYQSIQLFFMSWLNMDASNGFHFNSFDSNSNCFYHLREDSPQDHPPLFHEPLPEPYLYDRSLNFADAPLLRQKQSNEDSCFSPKNQSIDQESPEWKQHVTSARRGLKCLAELVIKLLRKKSLQQGEIVSLIEGILCKGRHEDGGKEEKNIKRRIYDALNVMIAAGLLEKEELLIKIKKKKPLSDFLELQPQKFEEIQSRVQKKRELLGKLISKKEALQFWIQRNKANRLAERRRQLTFPLIFVMEKQENLWMSYLKECILMKAKKLHLFSETDVIEHVHHLQKDQQSHLCNDME